MHQDLKNKSVNRPASLLEQLFFPLLQHLLPLLRRLGEAASSHLHIVNLALLRGAAWPRLLIRGSTGLCRAAL